MMEILITRNVNQPSMTLIGREATNFALFSPLVQVSIELLTLLYPEKGKKANSCSLLATCIQVDLELTCKLPIRAFFTTGESLVAATLYSSLYAVAHYDSLPSATVQ